MNSLSEFGSRLITLRDGRQGLRGGLPCEVKAAGDTAAPVLDFIATDETLDRYHEVISLDGWELDNYLKNPVVVDSHDYSTIAKIVGSSTSLTITPRGMINRVHFATDNPLGNLAYKLALGGFIKSESVGFIPLEWTNGPVSAGSDEPDRTYTRQELLEISLVAIPANPGATVGLALKSGAVNKADVSAVADFLGAFGHSTLVPAIKRNQARRSLNLLRQLRNTLKRA